MLASLENASGEIRYLAAVKGAPETLHAMVRGKKGANPREKRAENGKNRESGNAGKSKWLPWPCGEGKNRPKACGEGKFQGKIGIWECWESRGVHQSVVREIPEKFQAKTGIWGWQEVKMAAQALL